MRGVLELFSALHVEEDLTVVRPAVLLAVR